ncbi:hypothetical protein HW509_09705 [Asaia spathodeae]
MLVALGLSMVCEEGCLAGRIAADCFPWAFPVVCRLSSVVCRLSSVVCRLS